MQLISYHKGTTGGVITHTAVEWRVLTFFIFSLHKWISAKWKIMPHWWGEGWHSFCPFLHCPPLFQTSHFSFPANGPTCGAVRIRLWRSKPLYLLNYIIIIVGHWIIWIEFICTILKETDLRCHKKLIDIVFLKFNQFRGRTFWRRKRGGLQAEFC